MKKFVIQSCELTDHLKNQILDGLKEHALAQMNVDDLKPALAFIARSPAVPLMGAVVIQPFWGALHIKQLYVEKTFRGKGIGTALMEYALAYGKSLGHPFAFVETMSFQALKFYQKMGFILEFTRKGYSYKTSFHYLRKDL